MNPNVETSSALKAMFTKNMDTVTAAGAHIRFCACSACACAAAHWLLLFHRSHNIPVRCCPYRQGVIKDWACTLQMQVI